MPVIRFTTRDCCSFADWTPEKGPTLAEVAHVEEFCCPHCHHLVRLIAEIDSHDIDKSLMRYVRDTLARCDLTLGEADEFYETLCGVNYRQSKYQQTILRLKKKMEEAKARWEGERR